MGQFSIGQSLLRGEDPRHLQWQGRFYDDLKLADQLYAAILRSPHAHADILGIDRRAALQMPGEQAVLTGEDYKADGLGSLPSMAPYKRRGGGIVLTGISIRACHAKPFAWRCHRGEAACGNCDLNKSAMIQFDSNSSD
jgi:CO/xanthine dehydrogenase Mo-binding subunit